MPKVTSIFLPDEALQGQQIPSHVLWNGSDYTEIDVRFPTALEPQEVYNVSQGKLEVSDGVLKVNHVDVEGYLGLLFNSSRQAENHVNVSVEYIFHNGSEITYKDTRNLYLFRPDLTLIQSPKHIDVTFKEITGKTILDVNNRIVLKNRGQGTAVILINTTEQSGIKRVLPDYVRKFLENYSADLNKKFERLSAEFPQYSKFIGELVESKQLTLSEDIFLHGKRHKAFDELWRVMQDDRVFAKRVFDAFTASMLGNIYFRSMADLFLDYINSLGSNKTLFMDPFSVLKIPRGDTTLELEVISFDLLYSEGSSLPLVKIAVSSKNECELPLHRVIQWGSD